MKEPPITFLPSIRLLTPKLFTEVFTNKRMRIQVSRIMRVFSGEESCIISLGQITAQKRESQTMAAKLVAGTSQFCLISLYTERPEQLPTCIAG
jgi:hypothetical protein